MGTINIHPAILNDIYRDLCDDHSMVGDFGWLSQYLELQNKYAEIISAIQNGFGNITRSENENPAEILKELREAYNISASACSEMIFFANRLHQHEVLVAHIRHILQNNPIKAGVPIEE